MNKAREKIAVVTDSTADLDPAVAAANGISILPLQTIYKEGSYRDGVDITTDEIYARLNEEIPTTSTPSPMEAIDLLTQLRDQGFTHVVAVHLSGAISQTIETVRLAAREVSGLTTAIVDSKVVSMGIGFIALESARLAASGRTSFAAITAKAKTMVPYAGMACVLRTLEYFRKGGRIGSVAAAVAGVLSIKPIISMKDGVFYSPSRVRGRKQSLEALYGIVRQAVEAGANRVAVMHGQALEEAQGLFERVKALPGVVEPVLGKIGSTLAIHGGPGVVGVCVGKA